ncbi:hypothetical protein Tco_1165131 [Tanacetum coccineum]
MQNVRNQVVLNASQNSGVQNGLSVVSKIANQYGNGNVVTTPTEGNGNGINRNQIRLSKEGEAGIQLTQEEFDFHVGLMGTQSDKAPVYDLDGSTENQSLAKEADESMVKQKALELEIEHLLREVISQDIMSIVQNPTVVETSDLQTELERTKRRI